jgi:hypothetical protein
MKLPSVKDLAPLTTKAGLAEKLYPSVIYDTALPQGWVDICMANGFDPRPCVIWGYLAGNVFGKPLPLTAEAEEFLRIMYP